MGFRKEKINGQDGAILENDLIRISLLPKIGGKMVELTFRRSGTQFLQQSNGVLEVPRFGNPFDERFAFGFDECFPTVAPCTYSCNRKKVQLADHGEVWSRPWRYNCTDDSIQLVIDGVELDYTLEKSVSLSGSGVTIDYRLTNTGTQDFDYIWSAHPLLNIEPGDQLLLNEEISEVMVNWSSDPGIGGFSDLLQWPEFGHKGSILDWSVVKDEQLGKALKLFSGKLTRGRAGIYRVRTDQSLLFSFDPKQTPYLGIWLCYGGWPVNSAEKGYNLALEPASSRPDALDKAVENNEHASIKRGETKEWQLSIHCEMGKASV